MNKHPENRKPKGISVEGFWERLKTETENKTGETASVGAEVLSAAPHMPEADAGHHIKSSDVPPPKEDWVDRLDDWLDKLD